MTTTNPYCEALGIQVPSLEAAKSSPDANYYSLLIVALLERGEPITLEEAAKRFEEAGVAPADRALASLKRCRPGRPPIYRDGDLCGRRAVASKTLRMAVYGSGRVEAIILHDDCGPGLAGVVFAAGHRPDFAALHSVPQLDTAPMNS
jgi:hypothetical protein